ncbi:MAG TPA: hypothetical protein VD968_01470 [Pyrinomonadaceae bacterium]|nr:hypothetical protein [Pyrinomonadaceae bacterium]
MSSTTGAASPPASVFIGAGQVKATLGSATVGRELSVTAGACP